MTTVALIGPDGSGKSTFARALVERLGDDAVWLYMGVNPDESTVQSPVNRLAWHLKRRRGHRPDSGPPPPPSAHQPSGSPLRRARRSLRRGARTLNLVADELYRQRIINRHRRAGRVVVLDRDYWADYRTHDVENEHATLSRRLHGRFLERWYRKPDVLVYLDAPAEVLLRRKGEGDVETLRARQRDYLRLAPHAPRFETVDTDRDLDDVLDDLHALVTAAANGHRAPRIGRRRTVLVTDAARGSAVAIIRSLDAAGWRVVAADARRLAAGRYSRATDVRARYTDPLDDARRCAADIVALAERHDVDLIVPVTDDVGIALELVLDRLPSRTAVAAPPPEIRRSAIDKRRTIEIAREVGVPVPETIVDPADPDSAAAALGWPTVVKPARSRTVDDDGALVRHEVAIAHDRSELAAAVGVLDDVPFMLQQHVEGVPRGIEVLCADGRIVAAFQHRRVREVPLDGGPSSLRVSEPLDPELLELSGRLMGAIGWTGLAMIEWIVDDAGPHLMEINGRVWGSLPLAVVAGVDFPRMAAELFSPTSPSPGVIDPTVPDYEVGVRVRNSELELRWIVAALRDRARSPGEVARVGVSLLSPTIRDDIRSLGDPLPAVVDVLAMGAKAIRVRQRFSRRS